MKFKTTEKAIKQNYYIVVKVGYCDLQHLFQYRSPIAYTCGTYGWKADFYELKPNLIVSTGYAPIGKKYISNDRIREYEKKAEKIVYDWNMKYEDRVHKLDVLIDQFASEVYENRENAA